MCMKHTMLPRLLNILLLYAEALLHSAARHVSIKYLSIQLLCPEHVIAIVYGKSVR